MDSPYQYELKKLAEILQKLDTLERLPLPESPESRAMDHDEWMRRHREITDLYRDAEHYALLSIPPEVAHLLNQINRRFEILHNIESWESRYKRLQKEREQQEEEKGGG